MTGRRKFLRLASAWAVIFTSASMAWVALAGSRAIAEPRTDKGSPAHRETINGPRGEKVSVTMKEEFVYGLALYDGANYQGGFCPEEIDTVFLTANHKNIIVPRRTNVYFWPITAEYMADWTTRNEVIEGRLEVFRGGKLVKSLVLEDYALVFVNGATNPAPIVSIGAAARETYYAYQLRMAEYYRQVHDYARARQQHDELLAIELAKPVESRRIPSEPREPRPPQEYVSDVDRGFIIDLPPGRYTIRLMAGDRIVPGSEKQLTVFAPIMKGVGYEIIPETKWTASSKSDVVGENIYAVPGKVLYLRAFWELQYNSYEYARLMQPQKPTAGRGQQNLKTWVHTNALSTSEYTLSLDGRHTVHRVQAKPYYVRQRPGYALGYDITTDPGDESGATASFTAYRLEIPRESAGYSMHLIDVHGRTLAGSLRGVRKANKPSLPLLLSFSLLPLLVGITLIGRRKRQVTKLSNVC